MMKTQEILRGKGLKVTPQRMAIYSMLAGTTSHPSAEDIYKDLLPANPTMSLATVYKTLDSFKNIGLVQELNVGNGRSNYDANTLMHPHLVCTVCGRIDDFDADVDSLLKPVINELSNQTDYSIESQRVTFYGSCSGCKN